jgi:type IV pilus assembly protein PilE
LTSGRAAATNGRRRVGGRRGLTHNGGVNRFRHATPHRRASAGFTLIEIMIVAVVLALLAAVALPSFLDSLRKSRRAEAFTALSAVQQAQERWRSNNAAYSSNLTEAPDAPPPDPRGLGLPATTTGGLYTVALSGTSATGYTVSAVAVAGKSQAADTACSTLAVRVTGAQITYAGCNGCSLGTGDFAATNVCWSR